VEFLFEVKVDAVRVVNQPGKEKRFGRSLGRRQDWKKAYVRLVEGQQIEMGGSERA
jgi:large subunit ribosomal protein L23